MTVPVEPSDPAAHHLRVVVEPRAPAAGRRAFRWLGATLAAFLFGLFDGLTEQQVVVRDRTTGTDVLRLDVTDSEEITRLVDRLEEDLQRLDLDAFCEEWHVTPRS